MEKAIEILKPDEIQKLLEWCKGPDARPWDILYEIKLVAGLRSHEIVTMTISEFNLATGELRIDKPAKGSNKAVFDLNTGGLAQRLALVLDKYRMTLFADDPIVWCFTPSRGSPSTCKKWLERDWVGLRERLFGWGCKLGLHSLRHTFAQVARKRASMEEVQLLMRHKNISSTQKYLNRPTVNEALNLHREVSAKLYGLEGDDGDE